MQFGFKFELGLDPLLLGHFKHVHEHLLFLLKSIQSGQLFLPVLVLIAENKITGSMSLGFELLMHPFVLFRHPVDPLYYIPLHL
jgi:hypothetical protein